MRNEFEVAFKEISESRALPAEIVVEALQTALISAYRRDSGASTAQQVDATVDPSTGRALLFVEKEVVDEVFFPNTEVDLEKARYYDPDCDIGDTIMVQVEEPTKKFGRIAAQTAKQVILQKIREAERNSLYEDYIDKEGDIITGKVQSVNAAVVTLSLNPRGEAILPRAQQIPGERHKPHDTIRVYLLEVKKGNRGPQIIVSRSHRNMLRRLLEFEVPEIYNGQVEIKNIAREAGYRSKVAVVALQEGIDPVGACVGMRGIRIQNIVKELHDEKIDIIEWNPDQKTFISKSLAPARVTGVYLDDDPDAGRTAVVLVPDEDLSLAIGREGQNARLAAKLTGWRIDIKSVTESVENAFENLDSPILEPLQNTHAEMLEDVGMIMDKKANNLAVMPEEFRILGKFADLVETRIQDARLEARKARLAEINAVKETLPQEAFEIPVTKLDLPDEMIESLQPLENVGEIMLRFLIDENRLRRLIGSRADEALMQVQEALDQVMSGDLDELDDDEVEAEVEVEAVADELPEATVAESLEAAEEEVAGEPDAVVDVQPEVTAEPAEEVVADLLGAFPDEVPEEEPAKPKRSRPQPQAVEYDDDDDDDEYFDDDDDDDDEFDERGSKGKKGKKARQKRRQLIYDEETGQMIARRRRKGGRKREDWEDQY